MITPVNPANKAVILFLLSLSFGSSLIIKCAIKLVKRGNSPHKMDDILEKIFKPHVNDSGNIIYSYTGWYATGLSREMESEFNKHMKKLKQKKRINRKLKIVFRIVYILIKWHNQSKERLYHPNNPYVKNILSQRFNLFI